MIVDRLLSYRQCGWGYKIEIDLNRWDEWTWTFIHVAQDRDTWRALLTTVINIRVVKISPTRCNNCVFILRNGFTLHVSGDNLTHHQEYICCIWPQVSRLT